MFVSLLLKAMKILQYVQLSYRLNKKNIEIQVLLLLTFL